MFNEQKTKHEQRTCKFTTKFYGLDVDVTARITKYKNKNLLGFVSATLNKKGTEDLVTFINGMKIFNSSKGMFITEPAQYDAENQKETKYILLPLEFKNDLIEAIENIK